MWVDKFGDFLFRYAVSRLRDVNSAEDVVQQTFLARLKHVDQYSGKGSMQGWLLGILNRKIIDFVRERQRTSQQALSPTRRADWGLESDLGQSNYCRATKRIPRLRRTCDISQTSRFCSATIILLRFPERHFVLELKTYAPCPHFSNGVSNNEIAQYRVCRHSVRAFVFTVVVDQYVRCRFKSELGTERPCAAASLDGLG